MGHSEPFRTVLLRHDLPDGSHHFDWLIQQSPDLQDPLLSFRVDSRVDRATSAFNAVWMADHRAVYLTYEGPVSGDRGSVVRVAQGSVMIERKKTLEAGHAGAVITISVEWHGGPSQAWEGQLGAAGLNGEAPTRFEPVS